MSEEFIVFMIVALIIVSGGWGGIFMAVWVVMLVMEALSPVSWILVGSAVVWILFHQEIRRGLAFLQHTWKSGETPR